MPKGTVSREEIDRRVKRADELAEAAKSSWFVMLGVVAFGAIAVAGVADRDFFLRDVTTELPIVGVSVPTVGFFIAAPVILLAVYANFQFYVLKLWTTLAELPSAIPLDDAGRTKPLAEALQPWLVVDAALALKPDAPSSLFARLVRPLSLFLAWWAVPLVLAAFWIRSWPYHNVLLSGSIALLLAITVGLGIATYWWGSLCLRRASAASNPQRGSIFSIAGSVVALAVVLAVSTLAAIRGGVPGLAADGPQYTADLYRADLAERPADWLPRRQAEAAFLADYTGAELADLDTKLKEDGAGLWADEARKAFTERRNHFLLTFEASDLSDADLRGADLRYAFLPAVIMERADLRGAQLYSAQLEGALMKGARLQNSRLSQTELSCARLPGATFDDADMPFVRLHRAELSRAKMRRAHLKSADLSRADLSHADLGLAKFPDANLAGADLRLANLRGADLDSADLEGANLEGAIGDKNTTLPSGFSPEVLPECYEVISEVDIAEMSRSWGMEPNAFAQKFVCKDAVITKGDKRPDSKDELERCWPLGSPKERD